MASLMLCLGKIAPTVIPTIGRVKQGIEISINLAHNRLRNNWRI